MTVRRIAALGLAVAGTVALLGLTTVIGQQSGTGLGPYFLYQAAALGVAAVVTVGVVLLRRPEVGHLRWGDLGAPARPVTILAIKQTDTWRRVGPTFVVIVSVVLGVYLWLGYADRFHSVSLRSWGPAFLAALPLSASNALVEELITRWAVVEAMAGKWSRWAPWVSALIFGSVHWFGIPGGLLGSLMAGFLGWLLARSIQDTRGIGWAWITHVVQDVLIFTTTLALIL